MKYLFLTTLLLCSCTTKPINIQRTPFDRCTIIAANSNIKEYSYATEDSDGNLSCVIPLNYGGEF